MHVKGWSLIIIAVKKHNKNSLIVEVYIVKPIQYMFNYWPGMVENTKQVNSF